MCSFGIVLWELLTRREPFDDVHPVRAALQVMDGIRPELPADLNPELRSLIQDCWHQEPDQRPTFHEIRLRLESVDNPLAPAITAVAPSFSLTLPASAAAEDESTFVNQVPPPSGEVTFMFVDVLDFSILWQDVPSVMDESVGIFTNVVRINAVANNGYLVKYDNGAFMFAFSTVQSALTTAITIQEVLLHHHTH
jgi:hypothetical protein